MVSTFFHDFMGIKWKDLISRTDSLWIILKSKMVGYIFSHNPVNMGIKWESSTSGTHFTMNIKMAVNEMAGNIYIYIGSESSKIFWRIM